MVRKLIRAPDVGAKHGSRHLSAVSRGMTRVAAGYVVSGHTNGASQDIGTRRAAAGEAPLHPAFPIGAADRYRSKHDRERTTNGTNHATRRNARAQPARAFRLVAGQLAESSGGVVKLLLSVRRRS